MNKPFIIEDSQLGGKEICDEFLIPPLMRAVDELTVAFDKGLVHCISLNSYRKEKIFETPLWYNGIKTRAMGSNNRPIINRCFFYTSHYIGSFIYDKITIIIKPRFGNSVFNYLVQYATNLYLPEGLSNFDIGRSNPSWLIALIWKAMLNKAITCSQIPKQYIIETKNIRHFKGKLALKQHLRSNLIDKSRFYCTYHKLSMNNTINRTIRYTLKLLKKHNTLPLLQEFNAYDNKLKEFGVSDYPVTIKEIDAISFNKMTKPYKDVINICKLIIENHDGKKTNYTDKPNGLSYLIDIAELWEMYLLKLLQRHLSEYQIYSPNIGQGDFLLDENARNIRPDIIIEKDGKVIMIIDAKYKKYSQIGKNASISGSVSREDLYQMCTYLYHYGNQENNIVGIFVSPFSNEMNDVYKFTRNVKHRIGILNLPFEENATIHDIHNAEDLFIQQLRKILS